MRKQIDAEVISDKWDNEELMWEKALPDIPNVNAKVFMENHRIMRFVLEPLGFMPCDPGDTCNILGYGDVRVWFTSGLDHLFPVSKELGDVTGLDMETMILAAKRMVDEGEDPDGVNRSDLMRFVPQRNEDGSWSGHFLAGMFGVINLMQEGPWSEEVASALEPTMRRAMKNSGLGDVLRTVDGMTFNEAVTQDGPLPSAEVAREQATRGPVLGIEES